MSSTHGGRRQWAVRGWLLLAALLALVPRVQGAPDLSEKCDLWPLFYHHRTEPPQRHAVREVLWPFLEWREGAQKSEFYFRPFYNRQVFKDQGRVETEFLYPFGYGTFAGEKRERWFWPLFSLGSDNRGEGRERHFALLPFILWQERADKPDEFMLFPFYGQLYQRLHREEIQFILWPLYTREKKPDAQAWSVLFPIFRYEARDNGVAYKFWPLFGHAHREGKESKTFVLWPFYQEQWVNLDRGGKWESVFVFPFWGHESSPAGYAWTCLWPFFDYSHRFAGDERSWNAPWPILGATTGDNRHAHRLWPLYTYSYSRDADEARSRLIILWPLIWRTKAVRAKEQCEASSFRIIPLFWWQRDREKESEGSLVQVWPLFKVTHELDGSAQAEFPSILPLRRAGFERNYAPFFRLFEWRREADGATRYSLLWRVVRVERGADWAGVEVWPLFSWSRETTATDREESYLRLLKGLLGYERVAGRHLLRLLYVLRLPLGGAAPEATP